MPAYDPQRNRRGLGANNAPESDPTAPVDALLDRATDRAVEAATEAAADRAIDHPEPADDERRTGAVAPLTVPLPLPPADDGALRKAIAAGAAGAGVGVVALWWYVSRRRRRG